MKFLSFHERYVPLTEEKPVPTLAETRDRAIAENGELRQMNAELRLAGKLMLESHDRTCVGGECQMSGVDLMRALLTKVSR